jgi:Raf kinase inhibitor-like YbhB/YbcL family protein
MTINGKAVLVHCAWVGGLVLSSLAAQNPGGGQARPLGPADVTGSIVRPPAVVQTLTLTTTAWPDGGIIPVKYSQAGPELSPGIQWTGAPSGIVTYVLTLTDLDTVVNKSTDGLLHWMLWNIPGTATAIGQGAPDGLEWSDGTRQISVSGFRYRGPAAQAAGPLHHYSLELFALDTKLDVKVPSQGPQDPNPIVQDIRNAVRQAMIGHIRAKGSCVGLFHREP